tara:strand:+ start:940 stop:1389 length:450 start_codon:yes stop_codon:yes gene_type:complete
MELNFRKFIELSERNTVGYHNDGPGRVGGGAYQSSSQTGSEGGSGTTGKRGLMPSTDMGIIPKSSVTGTVRSIIKKRGRSGDIDVNIMSDEGRSKWIKMSRGQFDNYQGGGTGNAPLARGRRVTVDFEADSTNPNYDKQDANIGKMTVH